jgi:hypothetical protein
MEPIINTKLILLSGLASILALLFAYTMTACDQPESDNDQIKIYKFPPQDSSVPSPDSTESQSLSSPTIPTTPNVNNQDVIERHIVIDERNSTFPIGVPPGQIEETEVIAERPIDFWFSYVPEDLKLEINGIPVERSFRWESKIGHTTNVNNFKYTATNATAQYFSYNLHLVSLQAGESVSVTVRQKWSPLAR